MTLQKAIISDNSPSPVVIAELLVLPGATQSTASIIKGKGFIRDIDGLGPVDASISSTNNTTQNGVIYQDSRVGGRNIVLTLGFAPDFSVGETARKLRQIWYNILAPQSFVNISFIDDVEPSVFALGVVETHKPEIFAVEPTSKVSLFVAESHFKENRATVVNPDDNVLFVPPYHGSAPAGFKTNMVISQATDQFYIGKTGETAIKIVYDFKIGDTISLSTVPKNRYVRVTRNGTNINLLDNMVQGSLSMEVDNSGVNFKISSRSAAGTGGQSATRNMSYQTQHIGI